jgi:hypothetical protein
MWQSSQEKSGVNVAEAAADFNRSVCFAVTAGGQQRGWPL